MKERGSRPAPRPSAARRPPRGLPSYEVRHGFFLCFSLEMLEPARARGQSGRPAGGGSRACRRCGWVSHSIRRRPAGGRSACFSSRLGAARRRAARRRALLGGPAAVVSRRTDPLRVVLGWKSVGTDLALEVNSLDRADARAVSGVPLKFRATSESFFDR